MDTCIITNCDNKISERSSLVICPLCRSSIYRWRQKRPAQIMQRRANLVRYGSRMDNLRTKAAK